MTAFKDIYDTFFTYITDDLYMSLDEKGISEDLEGLLVNSVPLFEFPDKNISYTKKSKILETDDLPEDCKEGYFISDLTQEEINILATGMVLIWLQRQIDSIEVIKQHFSGADFKLTSQAAHLKQLLASLKERKIEHRHLQMLYSRRQENRGVYTTTMGSLVKGG